MDPIELLSQKGKAPAALYLKLLQKYKFDDYLLHYIFEGYEDQSFYENHLIKTSSRNHTYISLGKGKSEQLYKWIDWSVYERKRILFFIDRDYSRYLEEELIEDTNIYETTYYSVENYLANKDVLAGLINQILHFYEEDKIAEITKIYTYQSEKFAKDMKFLIAWILVVRKKGIACNINQINLGKLFFVDSSLNFKRHKVPRFKHILQNTQVDISAVSKSEIRDSINKFYDETQYKFYLRGKFDLWFFVTFFLGVQEYLENSFGHKTKVQTHINHKNAIEIIGPRLIAPDRLSHFINTLEGLHTNFHMKSEDRASDFKRRISSFFRWFSKPKVR